MFRCTWSKCRASKSVWSGTVFERSHVGPETLLLLLELWMKGLCPKNICVLLCISKVTFSTFLSEVSEAVVPNFYSKKHKIGGKNIVVEIDESKFGLRKYNRGHRVDGVWVLGMVERTEARRIFLKAVPRRDSDTLVPILKSEIHKDSIVYTDCWRAYGSLQDHFNKHMTVNHSKCFKDPLTGVHTNTIEGNWCAVKKSNPKQMQNSEAGFSLLSTLHDYKK